jgi:hypothetical protein
MATSQSDRNLLLGVLALQFGLVTRDQLVDAITSWGSDKRQTLDDISVRRNVLRLNIANVCWNSWRCTCSCTAAMSKKVWQRSALLRM